MSQQELTLPLISSPGFCPEGLLALFIHELNMTWFVTKTGCVEMKRSGPGSQGTYDLMGIRTEKQAIIL